MCIGPGDSSTIDQSVPLRDLPDHLETIRAERSGMPRQYW